jgi:hypothetical protein
MISNRLEKYLILGIITAILLMIVTGACVMFFVVSGWKNDSLLVESQKSYYKKLEEQLGIPQVHQIEQRYIYGTPEKNNSK